MAETIQWQGSTFMRDVESRSEAQVSACLQCHKCSTGCPMGPETDFSSSQVMRLIHLGDPAVVLNSKAIWICSSCQACTTRCPMGIDVAAVMDALRILAVEQKLEGASHNARQFNQSFLASVKRHGRVYEIGMMTAYKLRSLSLFSDVDKVPRMLAKGKLRLLFKRHKEVQTVRNLFRRAQREEDQR